MSRSLDAAAALEAVEALAGRVIVTTPNLHDCLYLELLPG
jgi:hypothetical protein